MSYEVQTGEFAPEPLDLDDYEFLEVLGQGSMGTVYLAEHRIYGYMVAIKRLHEHLTEHEELVARFLSEARAAAEIAHPGIVNVLEAGRDERTVYLVMEHVQGEILETRLANGRFELCKAIEIARQIADVLSAAHDVGIVHRDLKPDNVFLTRHPVAFNQERVRILDFGIAKFADDHRTRYGAVLGTPFYMAPEQFGEAQNASRASDIYSLGCVLYHMLCGRLPFGGNIEAILFRSRPPLTPPSAHVPEIPPELDTLIVQMLAEKPERRPREMRIVSAALRAVLAREEARRSQAA